MSSQIVVICVSFAVMVFFSFTASIAENLTLQCKGLMDNKRDDNGFNLCEGSPFGQYVQNRWDLLPSRSQTTHINCNQWMSTEAGTSHLWMSIECRPGSKAIHMVHCLETHCGLTLVHTPLLPILEKQPSVIVYRRKEVQ